ncbi:hypothetical protein MVEN_01719600 [Mycena venus]|uniref:Uncharacterized protein n=1 Tax=Mycena venus TaxID=2733690 RepID=A0A8H6XNH3_9AGAR|nr:hypothetical protein MVEN_01719600 [Mycena venus]
MESTIITQARFTFHQARLGGNIVRSPAVFIADSVNAMFYNRAPTSDYDDWCLLHNCAAQLETYQVGVINATHGAHQNIFRRQGMGKDFLVAAAALPRGRGFTEEMDDFSSCNVYGRLPKYINASTDRSEAAHSYLYPHTETHNPNFHALDNTRVNRLLFELTPKIGGEQKVPAERTTRQDARASDIPPRPHPGNSGKIGNKDVLGKHAIPLVCRIPGVGENYNINKDHHAVIAPYLVPHGTTLDGLGTEGKGEANLSVFEAQWKSEGNGPLAAKPLNLFCTLGEFRLNSSEARWKTFFAHAPDKPIAFVGPVVPYFGGYTGTRNSVYGMLCFTTYPKSTGSVHITSADPFAPLQVDTAFLDLYVHYIISGPAATDKFNQDKDLVVLRWAYKWSRELTRRTDSCRGEYAPEHPQFGCVDISAPEIQYSSADDAVIDAYHRKIAEANHQHRKRKPP